MPSESDLPFDDAEGELPSPLRRAVSKRPTARPFALTRRCQLIKPTEELQAKLDKFFTMLKAGNFVDTALALAGLDKQTFRYWCMKGKAEQEWWEREIEELHARGIDEPLSRGPYHDFLVKVDEAIAMAEAADLDNVRKAGVSGNASASIWRLKKRSPKRWGDAPVAPAGTTQNNTQVNVNLGGASLTSAPPELQVRRLLEDAPDLCDLLSLLAERAESYDQSRAVEGRVAQGRGVEGAEPRRESRALAGGPAELRGAPDAE